MKTKKVHQQKKDKWCEEIEVLFNYCSNRISHIFIIIFTLIKHYWGQLFPNISQNLKQLEKSIKNCFIKSLFHDYECNGMERELFELLAKYGGLWIINPSKIFDWEFCNSGILTQEGSQFIKNQHLIHNVNQNKLREIKNGEKSEQYQDTLTKIKQTLENDGSRVKLSGIYGIYSLQLVEHHFT